MPETGVSVDLSRIRQLDEGLDEMTPALAGAHVAMEALEKGAIANPDEKRMVGHYWLRAPDRAPSVEIGSAVRQAQSAVGRFAGEVHSGAVAGADGPIRHLVHIGIGGSALGPQLICTALSTGADRLEVHFLDNADPDGVATVVRRLAPDLGRTLISVVSKSGWTPTPMHVLREMRAAYEAAGLSFARHAVATTMPGSALDAVATSESWLACFPMWDWVGGRTSVTSAVGLLPLSLQGGDVESFLAGARAMDVATRRPDPPANPAALLALAWYRLGAGHGAKNMVVLPYRDRLSLLPRYVQQLVMESLGKERDRQGAVVHQGLTVYGNKGSTDQHAYLQQLHEGPADFFAVFVLALCDDTLPRLDEVTGATLGDFLFGYATAARDSLFERGRDSVTIELTRVDACALGALIALFERAVGLYAELVDVNAYHQPSVDKDAAGPVVELQRAALSWLTSAGRAAAATEIAAALGRSDDTERVYRILARLALDERRGVRRSGPGEEGFDDHFEVRP